MNTSEMGQVRATIQELLEVDFLHMASGVDVDRNEPVRGCGRPTGISGFTEWVAHHPVPMSIGWDWRLEVCGGAYRLVRTDCPRTNVQLTDACGIAFKWEQNLQILGTIVDALPWVRVVDDCFAASDIEFMAY